VKIAFIVPYPKAMAPSQRFRFEQQLSCLEEEKIDYVFYPFLTENAFQLLYKPNRYFTKLYFTLLGFLKRFLLMFQLKQFHFIFIHREASPIGPPIFEFIISKILKKKIIYDFDDAIWLVNTSNVNKIIAGIKWHHKVDSICKWAYKVSCGNEYLETYAKAFNKNVSIIPTTVDTELVHNKIKEQNTKNIVLGWTGTHSTIKYLFDLEKLLAKMQEKYQFKFMVISNKEPLFKTLKYEFVAWNKDSEIQDLLRMNVGIMPLKSDKWSKGKCGFKAIQYMALGIPAIVSKVGVNDKIVSNNINGFVCNSDKEWENAFEKLLTNDTLRSEFGYKSRKEIEENYSKKSQKLNYLNLFDLTF
jgi:glycosyltransferase involved in cell wall biosynthesis